MSAPYVTGPFTNNVQAAWENAGNIVNSGVTPAALDSKQLGQYMTALNNTLVALTETTARPSDVTEQNFNAGIAELQRLFAVATEALSSGQGQAQSQLGAFLPQQPLVPGLPSGVSSQAALDQKTKQEAVQNQINTSTFIGLAPLPSTSSRRAQESRGAGDWYMDRETFSGYTQWLEATFRTLIQVAARMGLVGGQQTLIWPIGNGTSYYSFNIDDMESLVDQYGAQIRHLKDIFAQSKKKRGAAPSGVTSPVYFSSTPMMNYFADTIARYPNFGTERLIYLRNGLALANTVANVFELSYAPESPPGSGLGGFNLKDPVHRDRLLGGPDRKGADTVLSALGKSVAPFAWAKNPPGSSKDTSKVPNTTGVTIFGNLEDNFKDRAGKPRSGRSAFTGGRVWKQRDIKFIRDSFPLFYMKVVAGMNSFNEARMTDVFSRLDVELQARVNAIVAAKAQDVQPNPADVPFRTYIPLHLLAFAAGGRNRTADGLRRTTQLADVRTANAELAAQFQGSYRTDGYQQAITTEAGLLAYLQTNLESKALNIQDVGLLGAYLAVKVGIAPPGSKLAGTLSRILSTGGTDRDGKPLSATSVAEIIDVFRKNYPTGSSKLTKEEKRDFAMINFLKEQGTVRGVLHEEMNAIKQYRKATGAGAKKASAKFDTVIPLPELERALAEQTVVQRSEFTA